VATECNDAVIYNTKDKIWYDAGQASGTYRSCGYTTEIFPTPVWASWEYNPVFNPVANVIATPAGMTAPTPYQIYLQGDVSSIITPGSYIALSSQNDTTVYSVTSSVFTFDAVTSSVGGVTLITVTQVLNPTPVVGDAIYSADNGYALWQHEFGVNATGLFGESSIRSSFTTCDISWVGGNPAQDTLNGVNRRMHLRRIEPDFVQRGNLTLDILGRKFARGEQETKGPFVFEPQTGKIDLRAEYREIQLKFTSNDLGGNYEMGRLLITAEYGDERP
jgi:hypothetical protein